MINNFLHYQNELSDHEEALIDELMSLVDFGQAINEATVKIAAERCPRIILENDGEGDGNG